MTKRLALQILIGFVIAMIGAAAFDVAHHEIHMTACTLMISGILFSFVFCIMEK